MPELTKNIEYLEQPVGLFYQCKYFLKSLFLGVGFYGLASIIISFLDIFPGVNTCYAIFSFETIGFLLVFGCLMVKILRIVQFVRTKHNIRKYSDYFLLKLLSASVLFWVGMLITGRIINLHKPVFLDFEFVTKGGVDYKVFKCHMGTMDDIKYVCEGLMLLVSMVFMYQTKDIRPPFNEGSWT
jgi:uncharacterized membrane protein YidH (DUF202 family)